MAIKQWLEYIRYCFIELWRGNKVDSPREYQGYLEYEEWAEETYDEDNYAWPCHCGHYEESGLHCAHCGNEPPWGCDCGFCHDRHEDEYYARHPEGRGEWIATWEAYPGELMADNIDFAA